MPYSNIIRMPVQDLERMTNLTGIKYSPYQKGLWGSMLGFFNDELRGGLASEHFKELNNKFTNTVFLVPGEASLVDVGYVELRSKLARTMGPKQGIIQAVEKALNEDNSLRFSIIPTHHLSLENNTKNPISEQELDEAISQKCYFILAERPTTFCIPYLNTQYDKEGRIIKPPYPEFGTHANTNFSPELQNHLFIRLQGLEAYINDLNKHFPNFYTDKLNDAAIDAIMKHARSFQTLVDSYDHLPLSTMTVPGYNLGYDVYESSRRYFKLNKFEIAAILNGLKSRNLSLEQQKSSINFDKQPAQLTQKSETEQFAEALGINAEDIKAVEPTAMGQGFLIILKTEQASSELEIELRNKLESDHTKFGEYIRFLGTEGYPSRTTTTRLEIWGPAADALDDYLSNSLDRIRLKSR